MKCSMMSVSRGQVYIQCPLKYHKQYEEGMRSEADHLDFGTAIHSVLEKLYREYEGVVDLGTITQLLNEEVGESDLSSFEHYEQGLKILEEFVGNPKNFEYDLLTLDNGEPALELEFYIDLESGEVYTEEQALKKAEEGRYIFRGFIDKVLRPNDDTLIVVDYKTSYIAKTKAELNEDLQLSGYNLAIRAMFPWVKNVIVGLNYLRKNQTVYSTRSWYDAETTRQYLLTLFKKILQDNNPKPKMNTYCSWCECKQECFAYQDLMNTPYEFDDYLFETDIDKLWKMKEKLSLDEKNIKKAKEAIESSIKMFMTDNDIEKIELKDTEIYLNQSPSSSYPLKVVSRYLTEEQLEDVVSVGITKVRRYLKEQPEALQEIEKSKEISFKKPSLSPKKKSTKTKKKSGVKEEKQDSPDAAPKKKRGRPKKEV